MDTLRSKRGCPWDREQTHETLRPFLLEETYEALDAIDRGAIDELGGELGDVLFQCVFHAQLGAEAGRFDIGDAVQSIIDKLIGRHPHVFTAAGRPLGASARGPVARTTKAVFEQWEALKAREQAARGVERRVLSGIPRALPALVRAHEIGTRVAAIGFDWPRATDVLDKIDEEIRELRAASLEGRARMQDELGDVLFSIANLARQLGLDPESALREANDKFTRRFATVEALVEARGSSVHQASLEELEAAWQTAKRASSSAAAGSEGGRRRRGSSNR